ncbi:MAG: Phosphate transport system regulatory protein PhoU, partial [uncultured Sphingomonas sp.]
GDPRTYAQGLRRGPRPAARAHQRDGGAGRAWHRRSDALPGRPRRRWRPPRHRGGQEARRSGDGNGKAGGSAHRPACAHGRRPARRGRRAQDLGRGGTHRRLCQEHRQAGRDPGRRRQDRALVAVARNGPDRGGNGARCAQRLRQSRRRGRPARVRPGQGGGRFLRQRVPHPADPHDGGPALHPPRDAPPVRRQEPGAGRRPCHQHRRNGLLRRHRPPHERAGQRRGPAGRL